MTTRAKGQGQWALGYREPLNPNERMKKDDDGLNVRARVENVYQYTGFAGIDPSDLRGRLRWWGLYTQRKPGIDGGRTAVLEPHELEDEYFMLRVRIDGGQLSLEQLRVIADISVKYARSSADLTDRQNIQLHWIRIEDVPAIWKALEAVGLSTQEACGDVPRVIVGSPVAGISAEELIDPTDVIREIERRFVGNPEFSNLPRKFKSSISWLPDVPYEVNDVAFVGSVHPDHGPGFDLWVGGGLAVNPMLAKRLGVWVPLNEIPEVWAGVIGIFRDYGYRRLRTKARLKFLVNDWGVEKFRDVLENEYLKRKLSDGPPPVLPERPIDHIGAAPQLDGNFYLGVAPVVGRISGEKLHALADILEKHDLHRVRTTAYQKLLVLDIPPAIVDTVAAELDQLGLSSKPSTWRRATMACTGIEYCKLAIVETKATAATLITELESRLGDVDADISININGCPNACARTQVADIGLKGILLGGRPGFQLHLGGGLAVSAGAWAEDTDDPEAVPVGSLGRKLRGLKSTAEDLPDYVERLTRRYLAARAEGETFAAWVARAEEEALA
ncbi:ferredoxin--nitrite reductase [Longispora fulva]|uniref:assimilatory sulfite reductase (ferredoxin) n=1 Tax=Longispora fulva TaxID=619741 RepID=A0A8J7GHU9_9ACTN|nr:nitrite/sulfite reductase [Longispora fulva]MBG6140928.1 sulfite reductase (ferredoxin) [Longispora fulva]GIG60806.1 ferredoxin--nitrite reductase [Longispora fulva]